MKNLMVAGAVVCMLTASTAYAAPTITMSAMVDSGSNWRSGNTVIGQAGYYLPGSNQRVLIPSFISSFTPNSAVYGGNANYALVDDPLTTPGAAPTKILSGTFNPTVGTGFTTTDFIFTVGVTVPSTFRVGLLVDNLDFTIYNSTRAQLVGGGTSASFNLTGTSFNNRLADWIFFDVSGATAGQTYLINMTAGSGTTATLGGVSFDTVAAVPEPAAWAMMILGMGAIGFAMRRQKVTTRLSYAV